MGWKFWLSVSLFIAGPLLAFLVFAHPSLRDVVGAAISWGLVSGTGIVVGSLKFRRKARSAHSSGGINVSRSDAAAESAVPAGLLGLIYGLGVTLIGGAGSTRWGELTVYIFYIIGIIAACTSLIGAIFGAGLGQSARRR